MKIIICYFSILITIVLSFFCTRLAAQEKNPFLDWVGKPFTEFYVSYQRTVDSLFFNDSLDRAKLQCLLEEASKADETGEWEFYGLINDYNARFYESRKGGFVISGDYTVEDHIRNFLGLAEKAQQRDRPFIYVWCLFNIAETYRIFSEDYERAFAYYLEAAALLENISTKEFPCRPLIYREIANLYYIFREYGEAVYYFRKITDDPEAACNYYKQHYAALSGLGGCYRNEGDYAKSDSCYRRLLQLTAADETDRWVWEGITEADIGYNYYLRGEVDTALKWLVSAVGKITRENDVAYVSQRTAVIADIYLKKNNPVLAKKYIDLALDYHARAGIPEKDSRLYDVLTRYYSYIGNRQAANAYLDSTLIAKDRENEAFSGLVLRRVEQQLRVADQRIHEQQFNGEQMRSRFYMHTTWTVSTALLIILVLLGLTFVFYRRKRAAYRELVRKSQQWARVKAAVDSDEQDATPENADHDETSNGPPDEADLSVMRQIERLMREDKIFRDTSFSLDSLARQLGLRRHYVSNAINRSTGNTFKAFVNEYRVKEAIRLLSTNEAGGMTIDSIAFESGFNDRKNFHRVFKKMTGLSPSDFRKNTGEK